MISTAAAACSPASNACSIPIAIRTGREQKSNVTWPIIAARNVIWLGDGIVGDDTDGHIDELARFVGPRCVVAAVEDDPADENYAPLADNLRRLSLATDEEGRARRSCKCRCPAAGPQLPASPASYMNFYIANGVVLVPQFDDPADAAAIEILARLFPDRQVIGLRAVELVWGLGAFHCITQQQPRP